jgi:hypothetical protein
MTYYDNTDKFAVMKLLQLLVGTPHFIDFPSIHLKEIPVFSEILWRKL